MPFAGLDLIGSRVLVGADDAYTAMVLRAGGAVANVGINAVLVFGTGMGVDGAAVGTVVSNVVAAAAFATGLAVDRLPGIDDFPITVDPRGRYADRSTPADLVAIGLPVMGRNLVWTVAEFPMFAILDIFGRDVASAFVVARRVFGLLDTPGWGFGLASSGLVGRELGTGDEGAAAYGREIIRFSTAVYVVLAAAVFALATPVVVLFVGDTRRPFAGQALGVFGVSIPLVYLGTVTPLGIYGLYLAFLAETSVPAALNYHRFRSGVWKRVSREYRPEAVADD